uniref:Ovule protein n=1 Tax=Brugia timori TaxID=42155 RepID=A0A0R3RCM7_9BILA
LLSTYSCVVEHFQIVVEIEMLSNMQILPSQIYSNDDKVYLK